MSAYDYDPPRGGARYDDRRDRDRDRDRDRYADPREVRESPYVKVHPTSSRELVPRHRDEADLVLDYPAGQYPSHSRDVRRARSAEPGYYDDDYYYYPDERDGHHRSRGGRGSSKKAGYADAYYEAEEKRRRRVLGRQEKIIAAVAGAALAVGGKEIYDRRAAAVDEEHEIQRNYLHSAALGAAGAVVGYQGAEFYNKRASKSDRKAGYAAYRGRDGRVHEEYYSDSDEDPSAKKGHRKFLESALGVTSLGAAMKALTGGGDKDRDDKSRSGRSRSRDSTRSTRSRANSMSKIQKAAMASLLAGATEAFRIAKEPGGWKGEKAKRVVTAALGAGAIGGAQDDKHGKRDIAESVIGGLLGNRLVHGSKKNIEEDEMTGRSRSRSRLRSRSESRGGGSSGGHSGLAALASAGLAALGAKKAMGRDDSRGRSGSPDRRHRSRSRSVVDSARKSLAKLGIGSDPTDDRRDDVSDYGGSRSSRRHRHYSDDDSYDGGHHRSSRRDRDDRYHDDHDDHDDYDDRSYRPRRSRGGGGGKSSDAGSGTDLGDSSDDERRARKMRGKQMLTTGLAAVATIHAAHGVYQSMEKRKGRKKAVQAGTMSEETAGRLRSKALMQDATAVGFAFLGIKGAIAECAEARETARACRLFNKEKMERHRRRLERQRSMLGGGYSRRRANGWATPSAPRPYRGVTPGPRGSTSASPKPRMLTAAPTR